MHHAALVPCQQKMCLLLNYLLLKNIVSVFVPIRLYMCGLMLKHCNYRVTESGLWLPTKNCMRKEEDTSAWCH
jgi:hypothetical protein